MKTNYLKNKWKELLDSFKEFDKRVIFIVFYDIIFFSIVLLCFLVYGKIMGKLSAALNLVDTNQLMSLPQNELSSLLASLKGFLVYLIAGFVVVLLIILVAMCFFQGLIWFKIARKKFDCFKKFVVVNLVWFLIWLILIVFLVLVLKKEALAPVMLAIILSIVHFTNILYVKFSQEHSFDVIKKSLVIGLASFYLIPYLIFGLIFTSKPKLDFVKNSIKTWLSFLIYYIIIAVVILAVSLALSIFLFLPENIQGVIGMIIILIYLAWARIYLYNVVKNISI